MRLSALVLAVSLPGLGAACGPRPADTAGDESAIRALAVAFNDYIRTQNDSAIAALYADEAVLMPPNSPRVRGPDTIRQFWAGVWPLKATITVEPASIDVSGDLAVEEGNYVWTEPTPTGERKDNGKYLVIWHRVGGAWRITQDMWSSDNPPMPMPAN